MNVIKTHKDLNVWKQSIELAKEVYGGYYDRKIRACGN